MEIIAAVLYSKDIYVVTNTVSEGRVGWVSTPKPSLVTHLQHHQVHVFKIV